MNVEQQLIGCGPQRALGVLFAVRGEPFFDGRAQVAGSGGGEKESYGHSLSVTDAVAVLAIMGGMRMLVSILAASCAMAQSHPLDGLTTQEYWTVYETLQAAGHLPAETVFSSVLLHPPEKAAALAWRPGQAMPRAADVLLVRQGKSFAGEVDIAAKKVLRLDELKDAQAPFVGSEMSGDFIKKDPRVVEALKKRGITDLTHVRCGAQPVAYRAMPEQATKRVGFGVCSLPHRTYHSWGRSIEGLHMHVDIVGKKVLRVIDTEVVPVPTASNAYQEEPERVRPGTTPIVTSQPQGPGFAMRDGEVAWQNWRFRFRIDQRVGVVLNLVRFADRGRLRSVMYEGSVSELFVPYMDTALGWNSRAFIDSGQFYTAGHLKPMRPDLDCPSNAAWFEGIQSTESGAPRLVGRLACLFERHVEAPAWRHMEGTEVYGRPNRQLVLRSAAVIGNYDYIMDWTKHRRPRSTHR
jgi:primary-amine oxidase